MFLKPLSPPHLVCRLTTPNIHLIRLALLQHANINNIVWKRSRCSQVSPSVCVQLWKLRAGGVDHLWLLCFKYALKQRVAFISIKFFQKYI